MSNKVSSMTLQLQSRHGHFVLKRKKKDERETTMCNKDDFKQSGCHDKHKGVTNHLCFVF